MTPTTPKLYLRVWPEWGSSGIWELARPLQPEAGKMVDYESLELPAGLRQDFEAWIEWFWDAVPGSDTADAFDCRAFCVEGLQLAHRLKAVVGPDIHVEFEGCQGHLILRTPDAP